MRGFVFVSFEIDICFVFHVIIINIIVRQKQNMKPWLRVFLKAAGVGTGIVVTVAIIFGIWFFILSEIQFIKIISFFLLTTFRCLPRASSSAKCEVRSVKL